ncbi:MAG: hypothetical protein HN348_09405 [Proteobacteria bacterium]|nr:hypothetical protein [Pseudomonadota bacterium]
MLLHLLVFLWACNPPIETNDAPAIKIVSPENGAEINQGDDVEFEILVRDRDGDELFTMTVETDLEGVLAEAVEVKHDEAHEFTLENNQLPWGTHLMTVTVDDGRIDGERVSTSSFTINQAPSAPVLFISNSSPTTNTNILGQIAEKSVDPETMSIVYSWVWEETTTGDAIGGSSFPATLASTHTTKGETWRFEVTATESSNGVEPLANGISVKAHADVTIGNTAPVAPGAISIVPAAPVPADNLFCSIDSPADDVDPADTITYSYEWQKHDGVSYVVEPKAIADTLPASFTVEGDDWLCSVTSSDGDDVGGTTVSSAVIIGSRIISADSASVLLTGDSERQYFGKYAVGFPADSTYAGYDLAIGVQERLTYGNDGGMVAIFSTSTDLTNGGTSDRNHTVSGSTNATLGRPILMIPDSTGDGVADLLISGVGDPDLSADPVSADPAVYLIPGEFTFFPNATPFDPRDSTLFVRIAPEDPSTAYGFGEVLGGGDIIPDGRAEVVIAQVDDYAKNEVFLLDSVLMVADHNVSSDESVGIIKSTKKGDRFGAALSAGGDVDGSGEDDLVVGTPDAETTVAVSLFYGSNLENTALTADDWDVSVTAEEASEMGYQVEIANIDGDGYDDILVGVPGKNIEEGELLIFFGSNSLTANLLEGDADVTVTGVNAGGRFGDRIIVVGDRGTDGLDEILVAAPYADEGANNTGSVFLFYGSTLATTVLDTADIAAMVVTGENSGDKLTATGPAGDLDLDGTTDWMVASPGYSTTIDKRGRLYIFLSDD